MPPSTFDSNESENPEAAPEQTRWESWMTRPSWARKTLAALGALMIGDCLVISIALFSLPAQADFLPKSVIALLAMSAVYLAVYVGPGRPRRD